MNESEARNMNPTALAYIGDAVYEVFVRERLLSRERVHVDALHKAAVRYVKAEAQAKAARELIKAEGLTLTPEELSLLKRARNHKISSKAKNASPVDYKLATSFEALVGYLYLSGQEERLKELMEYAITISTKEGEP